MDVAKLENSDDNKKQEEVVLPGFRFHPTDEELVGFYLQRKVEKKPLRIELIKQVDIYRYDPWDLPMNSMGDKEWYFFCRRGRKYKNSIRPNRVTKSGFWKATGIDKPVYCVKEPQECIGLKKSLVYYRGSAGKGTKTDWMMHEFRLPPSGKSNNNDPPADANNDVQEAEVWTLCRIFKRIPSCKKYRPNVKVSSASVTKPNPEDSSSSKSRSLDFDNCKPYWTFRDHSVVMQHVERKRAIGHDDERKFLGQLGLVAQAPSTVSYPSYWNQNVPDAVTNDENWDELRYVVHQFAIDPSSVGDCRETFLPTWFS